ncbi:MAG: hypothetical protein ACI8W7_000377 [Gammaproteobacteria bacterium]
MPLHGVRPRNAATGFFTLARYAHLPIYKQAMAAFGVPRHSYVLYIDVALHFEKVRVLALLKIFLRGNSSRSCCERTSDVVLDDLGDNPVAGRPSMRMLGDSANGADEGYWLV